MKPFPLPPSRTAPFRLPPIYGTCLSKLKTLHYILATLVFFFYSACGVKGPPSPYLVENEEPTSLALEATPSPSPEVSPTPQPTPVKPLPTKKPTLNKKNSKSRGNK